MERSKRVITTDRNSDMSELISEVRQIKTTMQEALTEDKNARELLTSRVDALVANTRLLLEVNKKLVNMIVEKTSNDE